MFYEARTGVLRPPELAEQSGGAGLIIEFDCLFIDVRWGALGNILEVSGGISMGSHGSPM